jgi:hypothetical protein
MLIRKHITDKTPRSVMHNATNSILKGSARNWSVCWQHGNPVKTKLLSRLPTNTIVSWKGILAMAEEF